MAWLVMMVIVWFVMARRWRRRWAYRTHMYGYGGRPLMMHRHGHRGFAQPLPMMPPVWQPPTPKPALSRFETLKRRYVGGEITVEEYERELDELLRQPGGLKEV